MSQKPVQHRPSAPRESIAFARRTFHGAKAVGSFLPSLTTKALQKYGFSAASLITDWPAIMGRELRRSTRHPSASNGRAPPSRPTMRTLDAAAGRSGAMLVLRVDGAKALDVQYRAQQIIERINAYFGYAAVAQLRVIQAPMPQCRQAREPRARAEPLTREVAGIADAGLRDALARLGAEVRTRPIAPTSRGFCLIRHKTYAISHPLMRVPAAGSLALGSILRDHFAQHDRPAQASLQQCGGCHDRRGGQLDLYLAATCATGGHGQEARAPAAAHCQRDGRKS